MQVVSSGELHTIGQKKKKNKDVSTPPPLLCPVSDRPAEPVHYLGVAYGVTQQLLTFWKRAGYSLVYIRYCYSAVLTQRLHVFCTVRAELASISGTATVQY